MTFRLPDAQWDDGKGSHHPDYDPRADGTNVLKASRETEELFNAIVKVRPLPPRPLGRSNTDRRAVEEKKIDEHQEPRHDRHPVAASPNRSPRPDPYPDPRAPPRIAPQNDVRLIYKKIEEGADVNFVFGNAHGCPEGYTRLMSACNRGRLDAAKALLRSGADPNFMNAGGDLTLFWAIDGGPELIKLLVDYGVDLDARTPKDWTALSYARACG